MKHTPEPWIAAELGVISNTLTSHGNFYICSLIDPENEEDKANARRIVAAVNAAEGIETEVLEKTAGGLWNDVVTDNLKKDEHIEALQAQNARLLGALKTIQSYDEGNGCCPYGCDCPTIARAAIAEAEETVQPRTTAVEPPAQRLFKATKEITSYLRKQYPWNLSEPFKSLLIEAENALDDPHGYEPKGIVAPVKQPEKRTGAPTTGAGIARLYGGAALCKLYLPPPLKHIMYNVFLLEKNKYVLRGSGTLAEVRAILYRKKQHGYIVLA